MAPTIVPTPPPDSSDPELSAVVVPLLKGVVYQEERPDLWQTLLDLQPRVRDYVSVLGLELMLDESEGYAFLRSIPEDGESPAAGQPRLIARRQLSFPVSLLLALLRKKLAEFDAGGSDTRLVLSREDVVELVRVFLSEGTNEARIMDQVDTHLNKIVGLGFLRRLRGQDKMFEARRILKAFVDAQWLSEFDQRLAQYQKTLTPDGDCSDG